MKDYIKIVLKEYLKIKNIMIYEKKWLKSWCFIELWNNLDFSFNINVGAKGYII
jgi:hypothetical protein